MDNAFDRLRSIAGFVLLLLPFGMVDVANGTESDATTGVLRLAESDSTITVKSGEHTVLVYNKQSPPNPPGIDPVYRRSGFLHPVMTPTGKVVTAIFPFDHAHQHGIFSAWVNTTYDGQKIDFWNLAGRTGRVVHERVVSTFKVDDAVGFEVDLIHRTEQDPKVEVLRDRWKVSVRPTNGSYFCFDLETRQHALTDKPLVVNRYHYGGVAYRGPVRWLLEDDHDLEAGSGVSIEPNEFTNDHGSTRKKGNHEHARWVTMSGLVDGKDVSITVLCHPDNFRAPQAARLHPTKPYFCFAPCVDGKFTIDKAHPFQSRYRYLVTDDHPDPSWLEAQWATWSK